MIKIRTKNRLFLKEIKVKIVTEVILLQYNIAMNEEIILNLPYADF
jgi:hypothetical protein